MLEPRGAVLLEHHSLPTPQQIYQKDLYKYDTDTANQVGIWRNCGTMDKTCLTEFVCSNNAESKAC